MKPLNSHTANEFHDWQRAHLDERLCLQDLDAWALSVVDRGVVVALLELKRSWIEPADWHPFDADRGAYASLLYLARAARVPLFVLYWRKGSPIDDETPLAIFRLDAARPAYRYVRELITADELERRFPDLNPRP